MILLTCAVREELAFLSPLPHVELLVTGVGVVEAGVSVSRALAQSPYDLVINAGIAGAFEGAAEIGSGVVVSEERLELCLEDGSPLALPGGASIVDRAASDLTLVDRLAELGFRTLRGITVSQVTASSGTARRLAALGAGVESMEGFAVLRAAGIAGTPAIEVRGISNIVGERSHSGWNFSAGVSGLEAVLNALLTVLGRTDG